MVGKSGDKRQQKEATRKESNGGRDNTSGLDSTGREAKSEVILRAPFYILVISLYCLHSRPPEYQENRREKCHPAAV